MWGLMLRIFGRKGECMGSYKRYIGNYLGLYRNEEGLYRDWGGLKFRASGFRRSIYQVSQPPN